MIPHHQSPVSFSLGRVLATPQALATIEASGDTPAQFLLRHTMGDWGCVSPEDGLSNTRALQDGTRILSVYKTRRGDRIWIITEACDASGNRTATTILLPEEY